MTSTADSRSRSGTPPEIEAGTSQHGDSQQTKRRRLRGACDKCRIKKTKCDSARMPGNRCTNCRIANMQCSHDLPNYHKRAEMQQAYIQNLEDKVRKLEGYIEKLHPGKNVYRVIALSEAQEGMNTSIINRSEVPKPVRSLYGITDPNFTLQQTIASSVPSRCVSLAVDGGEMSEEEDLDQIGLSDHLVKLSTNAVEERFFGQSSVYMFSRQVCDFRHQVAGLEKVKGTEYQRIRRHTYWDIRPWELSLVAIPETPYIFPEEDLLRNLVYLYFEKTNSLLPILHRPTFMKALDTRQHLWDSSFGMTVLLVCSIGSRYSHDPRVLSPNDTSALSSGWKYFSQVTVHRKINLYRTSVYDLQYYILAALYLTGTTMSNAAWILLGMGIRFALEKGIHRRRGDKQAPTAERELQKRAFWALVCLDRIECSFVGRPCSFPHETFDVEYPIECDDEYWETDDPEQAFRQPEGKPCTITAFVCFIKLVEILGFALRTLYTNKKSKIISGFIGSDWEGRMVAELDSAMNKWKESLPDHLKWEPDRQDLLFFHQSVDLHVTYNYVQIQIHRPYLTRPCCLTFSSLAMCTTAARSTAHILEAATTRGLRIFPMTITGAFTSGLVILVGLWGGQSIGYVGDPERDMQTVAKCLNVLKECEKRWIWAGRLRDIINETGALHEYYPTKGDKRSYEASEAASSNQTPATVPSAIDGLINTAFTSLTEIDENPGMMATPEFDWDRLLLSEMGYLPDFPRDNIETLNPPTSHRAYNSQGPTPSGIEAPHSQITPGNSMHSSWDNLPNSSFRVEEWDAYLRSMGQS